MILKAIKKYGRENFSRVILEECTSQEELNKSEIKWIAHYDAVNSKEFYNIAIGGNAGDTWSGRTNYSKRKFKKRIAESNSKRVRDVKKISGTNNPAFGRHWYKDMKNRKQYYLHEGDPLINELGLIRGMFRTKKHNQKISEAHRGKKKNYTVHIKGKISVSKDGKVKFIRPDEINEYLNNGYIRGNVKTKKQTSIYMNDGKKNKLVNKKQVNHYLEFGYSIGRLRKNPI